MNEKSANGILRTTIEKVRDLVDVSTIIGEPITLPDGLTIIPVSKVTYGFASGGSDFPSKNNVELFGGAGGAGMAAALPGVIAAETPLPVIGVPIKGSVLEGLDATFAIMQMPPGIPGRKSRRG